MGTFISPDPVIPDPTKVFAYNRYMYAYGNPLRYSDPTGHYIYEDKPDDPYIWRRDKPNPTLIRTKEPVVFWEETQDPDIFLPLEVIYGGALVKVGGGLLLEESVGLTVSEVIPPMITGATQAWRRLSTETKQIISQLFGKSPNQGSSINWLESDTNRVSHIMQDKHLWGRITTLTGDQLTDYRSIQPFIQRTFENAVPK